MPSKTFSAVVEIGGAVKDSFRSSVKLLGGDLSGIGDAVREAKGKLDLLGNYDPEGVRKLERQYYNLRREARKLRKEYDAADKPTKKMAAQLKRAEATAKKAGTAYKNSRDKLDTMGKALHKAGIKTSNLAGEHRRLSSELERSKDRMNRFTKAMEKGGEMRGQIGDAVGTGAGVAAGVTAIGAAVTIVNKATSEQVALAKSLSVSTDALQAWGGVAKEAGYEVDTIGDLVEEMNNKLGESAGLEEITPVKESLEILGLSFEELRDMKPEEQFKRIAQAIKEMPDDQQAVAAADILMGGEANKFFGYLRSRKEGVEEILAQQKRLNVLSEEGRAGAAAYNTAFARMSTVVGSATAQVSGLIGGALAPLVEEYAPKLADWVTSHRQDLIEIGNAVRDSIPAFLAFGRGVGKVASGIGSMVSTVASLVGGFDNLAVAIGLAFGARAAFGVGRFVSNIVGIGQAVAPLVATHFPALAVGFKAIGTAAMANPIGLIVGGVVALGAAVYRVVTAWDKLVSAWKNSSGIISGVGNVVKTFFGFGDDEETEAPPPEIGDAVKKAVPVASARAESFSEARPVLDDEYTYDAGAMVNAANVSGTNSHTNEKHVSVENHYEIHVHTAPGQSAEEIADVVMQRIEEEGRNNARLALHD
ncbi:hypothetical protein D0S45_17345 [Marinifilum sp. JC120]|nr:hypothetical protein D0S45_17345 [Marinifilum sp. JC120]